MVLVAATYPNTPFPGFPGFGSGGAIAGSTPVDGTQAGPVDDGDDAGEGSESCGEAPAAGVCDTFAEEVRLLFAVGMEFCESFWVHGICETLFVVLKGLCWIGLGNSIVLLICFSHQNLFRNLDLASETLLRCASKL